MPKAAPAIVALNAGEFSPLVEGRIDLDQYRSALTLCENFIPIAQGALRNRPGTTYINTAKSSTLADKTRLVSFVYSQDQSYVLEFGNLYFRVYRNRAYNSTEVVTPWATADLPLLQFTQSADVLYVTHPSYPPYQIARTGHTSWTCTALTFDSGPFLDDNPDSTTLAVSGTLTVGGTVTLTASASYFTANMVGALFRLWATNIDIANYEPWEPGKGYGSGDRVYHNGRFYLHSSGSTSGTVPPTHEEGSRLDGVGGVKWTFESAFFGIVRIATYSSATSVTATVVQRLPAALGTNASARWAEGAWSAENGYPAASTFYQDRLWFGGTTYQPDTAWGSGIGDYPNFNSFNLSGQITADLAITVTVASQQVNRIRWMRSDGANLVVGTEASEFLIAPATTAEGLSQSNLRIMEQTNYGSDQIAPLRVGPTIIIVQRAGRQVRELTFSPQDDRYIAPDMTALASHITSAGVADMAYAPEPHDLVWVVLDDGGLRTLTYDRDQGVMGWARHTLGGAGDSLGNPPFVESVAVIPSPDGTRSDAWLCVRWWLNGALKRCLVVVNFDREIDGAIADANHLDCSVTYDSTAASTITGLGHLNGVECRVIADGYVHPNRTPSSGSITLERNASTVHVGLFADAKAETMQLEAGAANGTAQAKVKRISGVTFRVYNSTGGRYGVRGRPSERFALINRAPSDLLTAAQALVSGDYEHTWPAGHETAARIYFEQNVPLPMNMLALFPIVDTKE
ncbi:MAG: hypothetical protein WAT70_03775 [Rhizobiaceae bacterium]